jgi:hypothetical protein
MVRVNLCTSRVPGGVGFGRRPLIAAPQCMERAEVFFGQPLPQLPIDCRPKVARQAAF